MEKTLSFALLGGVTLFRGGTCSKENTHIPLRKGSFSERCPLSLTKTHSISTVWPHEMTRRQSQGSADLVSNSSPSTDPLVQSLKLKDSKFSFVSRPFSQVSSEGSEKSGWQASADTLPLRLVQKGAGAAPLPSQGSCGQQARASKGSLSSRISRAKL